LEILTFFRDCTLRRGRREILRLSIALLDKIDRLAHVDHDGNVLRPQQQHVVIAAFHALPRCAAYSK
jgi:hypothetical protein